MSWSLRNSPGAIAVRPDSCAAAALADEQIVLGQLVWARGVTADVRRLLRAGHSLEIVALNLAR